MGHRVEKTAYGLGDGGGHFRNEVGGDFLCHCLRSFVVAGLLGGGGEAVSGQAYVSCPCDARAIAWISATLEPGANAAAKNTACWHATARRTKGDAMSQALAPPTALIDAADTRAAATATCAGVCAVLLMNKEWTLSGHNATP